MRYLITGGSGYLGSRVLEQLAALKNTEVVVNADIVVPEFRPAGSSFRQIDVRDANAVATAIAAAIRPERVACTSVLPMRKRASSTVAVGRPSSASVKLPSTMASAPPTPAPNPGANVFGNIGGQTPGGAPYQPWAEALTHLVRHVSDDLLAALPAARGDEATSSLKHRVIVIGGLIARGLSIGRVLIATEQQVGAAGDLLQDAPAQRLFRVKPAPGQQQVHRHMIGDALGQLDRRRIRQIRLLEVDF